MTLDRLFSICSGFALVGWLFLVLAPRWRWTARLVLSGWWSLLLCAIYLLLIVRFMPGAAGGFGSIAEVRLLFGSDALLLAGWVHYLAFDLLVGALEVRQAQTLGIPHIVLVPALILTFLFGPIGLLLFAGIRAVRTKSLTEAIS